MGLEGGVKWECMEQVLKRYRTCILYELEDDLFLIVIEDQNPG